MDGSRTSSQGDAIRTVTVLGYRRPNYLRQTLDALRVALFHCPEYKPDRIVIGIDPGADEQAECVGVALDFPEQNREIILWPERLGPSEHPRRMMQYAFMELRSDYNLQLEDDIVLSPDALRLALWYADRTWSFHDCRTIGMSLYSRGTEFSRPADVCYRNDFSCWAFCCSRPAWWACLMPWWNYRRTEPLGWDHSVTSMMKKNNFRIMHPALSRVHNIGREGGWYQTPEGYDRDFEGVVWAGTEHMQENGAWRLQS